MATPPDAVAVRSASRPRLFANLALGLIALASLVALLWPYLPGRPPAEIPVAAGVVLRLIEDPAPATPRVGGVAPDFEWVTPAGDLRRLSTLRGRTVVLNFWATWCEPCREEMPALDRVAADPAVAVVAVDLDESAAKVDGFLAAYGLARLEAVIDPGKKVALRYGVVGLPTTFFIDAAGVIRHLEIRGLDERSIRAGIARAKTDR